MRQVLQDLATGEISVLETPEPAPAVGRLLVRVQASLLSAGTESAQVSKARQSLFEKVRQKPELIRQGIEELRDRGWSGLREKVASKYEGLAELGYSCAGTVVDSGGDSTVAPGTRVACGGGGAAVHAEFVSVPRLLTAMVPDEVAIDDAAFATVGAIALQGVRQAGVQIGEYVAVIGLGLVGLLTTQLLRANGCRVVGIDPSPTAQQRGRALGCDAVAEPAQANDAVARISGGLGADAVIICAATTESSPVELAGKLARSRGRIVMVGATGMTLPRDEYFIKELSFALSRSYGPGRYDRRYEEEGHDYPIDYVRFTEQRNMRAFLELLQRGRLEVKSLITHRFPIEQAPAAYALLNDRQANRVGIVLDYASGPQSPMRFNIAVALAKPIASSAVSIGFVGAGTYAQSVLLPLLKKRTDSILRMVVTRNGSHALHASHRFGFENAGTRIEDLWSAANVELVFICTRHDSHAQLACAALRAGKHVWVEKPLALTLEELRDVAQTLREHPTARLIVGFNRPFSPSASWLMSKFGGATPRLMHYRVNAGAVTSESWVNDPVLGGGRLLGEGCHFLDFFRHMAGSRAEMITTEGMNVDRTDVRATANFAVTVQFANGSVGQLLYTSLGAPKMGKEHFECFSGQRSGALHDFRDAEFFHSNTAETLGRHPQDKGQSVLLDQFIRSLVQNRPSPITVNDLLESSALTLAAQQSLVLRRAVAVGDFRPTT